jgi:hypothetical protein
MLKADMFFEDWVVLHSINSLANSYTIPRQVVRFIVEDDNLI